MRRCVDQFSKKLPARNPELTNQAGYDYVMLVPVAIDNVNPPELPRQNRVDINVDAEYERLLSGLLAVASG